MEKKETSAFGSKEHFWSCMSGVIEKNPRDSCLFAKYVLSNRKVFDSKGLLQKTKGAGSFVDLFSSLLVVMSADDNIGKKEKIDILNDIIGNPDSLSVKIFAKFFNIENFTSTGVSVSIQSVAKNTLGRLTKEKATSNVLSDVLLEVPNYLQSSVKQIIEIMNITISEETYALDFGEIELGRQMKKGLGKEEIKFIEFVLSSKPVNQQKVLDCFVDWFILKAKKNQKIQLDSVDKVCGTLNKLFGIEVFDATVFEQIITPIVLAYQSFVKLFNSDEKDLGFPLRLLDKKVVGDRLFRLNFEKLTDLLVDYVSSLRRKFDKYQIYKFVFELSAYLRVHWFYDTEKEAVYDKMKQKRGLIKLGVYEGIKRNSIEAKRNKSKESESFSETSLLVVDFIVSNKPQSKQEVLNLVVDKIVEAWKIRKNISLIEIDIVMGILNNLFRIPILKEGDIIDIINILMKYEYVFNLIGGNFNEKPVMSFLIEQRLLNDSFVQRDKSQIIRLVVDYVSSLGEKVSDEQIKVFLHEASFLSFDDDLFFRFKDSDVKAIKKLLSSDILS